MGLIIAYSTQFITQLFTYSNYKLSLILLNLLLNYLLTQIINYLLVGKESKEGKEEDPLWIRVICCT